MENKKLHRAELKFDKLAKLAEKIKIREKREKFLPYTEKELADAAEALKIIDRIENIHCKLDV